MKPITTTLVVTAALVVLVASVSPVKEENCQRSDDYKGEAYRGTVSVTVSGRDCQRWDSQSPNQHSRTPSGYPNSGLEENYCRNPDDAAGVWCYNDEGTDPRWEYCAIPACPATEKDLTLKINCDDKMNLWVDGDEKYHDNMGVWHKVSTFVVPKNVRVIAVKGVDYGGGYGITASVTDSNGRDVLVTDESWKCSTSADAGWETLSFKEGANWKPANIIDNKHLLGDASASDGLFNMSPKRKVIWADPSVDTVYCRKVIDLAECTCDNVNNDDFDLQDVDYDIKNGKITEMPPQNAGVKTIENETSQSQQTKYIVTKTVSETSSFEHTTGASISVGTTFGVGIPIVAMGEISVEVSASYDYTEGQSREESKSVTAEFWCTSSAYTVTECQSFLFRDKVEVPYTMTWIRKDDPTCICKDSGNFSNITGHRLEMQAKEVGKTEGGDSGKKKGKGKKDKSGKKDKKKKDKAAKKDKKKGQ